MRRGSNRQVRRYCYGSGFDAEIAADIMKVNGRPLIFRGVNRHEINPVKGRMFDAAHARADLIMMKRAGGNAIRTSHYPPHAHVLDLSDELGFWVIEECDYETHAFEVGGWQGNPSDDPRWEEACLDRIARRALSAAAQRLRPIGRAAECELVRHRSHVYLFLDDAVHGIGSRACGVDVLPEDALWPSARQFAVSFQKP